VTASTVLQIQNLMMARQRIGYTRGTLVLMDSDL
jgi:hypothetical protein